MKSRAYLINEFELLDIERRGGMSRIQQARMLSTGDLCALKYPSGDDASASTSFHREATALGDMDHRNIVRLHGIGSDGSERFLALEWLEESLRDRIASLGALDWVTFYEQIGRPLLDGLQYAHARGYVHRDLKPLNVMFSRLGVPKITDFGISRGVGGVRLGVTFAAVGSQPWTPPEQDDGTRSETRDLYSWAAICVSCLTGRQDFKLPGDLRASAEKLGEIAPKDTLMQCLAEAPIDRPPSATFLLWELDDFHKSRLDKVDTRRVIGLEIAEPAHRKLETLVPEEREVDLRVKQLFNDYLVPCEVGRLPEGDLEFAGHMFCLRAGRGSPDSPWLIVKDIRPASGSIPLEPSMRATVSFVQRASAIDSATQSRLSISFIESFLRSAEEKRDEEQRRRDEERYLTMLQDVLAARMRALRDLPAIGYIEGLWEGGEYSIRLDGEEAPEVGEQRIIRTANALHLFEVSKVVRDRVLLRPIGQRRGQLPQEGLLQVDTVAQRRALERQEEAVRTLRNGVAVLPTLKRLMLKPGEAEAPESGGRPAPIGLSDDKVEVLDAALGLRQLMVVQGPPGTGKTTLIAELVKQYLKEHPEAKVLIAAQTHIAIDHVIGKLLQLPETAGRIVRIARADEDKVAESVRTVLLQRCVARWCATSAQKAREFIRARGAKVGLDADSVERYVRLQALLLVSERQRSVKDALAAGQQQLATAEALALSVSGADVAETESATVATMTVAELQSEDRMLGEQVTHLREELGRLGQDGRDLAELQEEEMNEWLALLEEKEESWRQFRREVEVQVAWLDMLGQLKQFEELVLRTASVVAGTCVGLGSNDAFLRSRFDLCIIDEASKATATEVLIPMVRSERCLIVGDPKQLPPFDGESVVLDEYGSEELRETLLDYLLPRLPRPCVFQLTHQHRMCKSIGDLISDAFYDGTLVNTRSDQERPLWMRKMFEKPVVWIDTQGSNQRRKGYTYTNPGEQDAILDVLKRLQHGASRAKAKASVAIVAGYAAQAYALDARVQKDSFESLAIEVATVDSFQGREADVCVFSVTLSNSNDFLGFLRSMKRLNVALSRPKDLLIIVGDQGFCYHVPGDNPFTKVIDHIDANPTCCETRHAGK